MQSIFEQLSEIIENAGAGLYSLIALIVLVTGFLAFRLFNPKATNRQERTFLYVLILFFFSIFVSVSVGFSSGQDTADDQGGVNNSSSVDSSKNPLSVTLEPEAMQALENYLIAQNTEISPSSKTVAVSKAIEALVQPENKSMSEGSLDGISQPPNGNSVATAFPLEPLNLAEPDYAWHGSSRVNDLVPEQYHRFRLEENSEVRLVWDNRTDLTLLDSQESEVRQFNLGKEGEVDLESGTYYIKVTRRYTTGHTRFDYEFRVFANAI